MSENDTSVKETPEQTIARAQEIINVLRDHLQQATDALVSVQVDNNLLRRALAEFTEDKKEDSNE